MALKDLMPDNLGPKAIKYSMVSVVAVIVTQVVIVVCVGLLDWPWVLSNFVAVTIGCVPSYTLNRAWVWGKRGKNHWRREVLPFWLMALLGLAFSTLLVAIADQYSDAEIMVNLANLFAFGILWVVKFMVLDAVLFKQPASVAEAADVAEVIEG